MLRKNDKAETLVIEKHRSPMAAFLSIRDYIRLAAPEPDVLRILGEESRRNRTDKLTSKDIDQIVTAARKRKARRR